jgi:prepilin-type N-terminal cleavage/methylation domain-containing protein
MRIQPLNQRSRATVRGAFTLVEILIVVVILGILSAIVVPQFSNATSEAARTQTYDELQRIRRAVAVYYLRNGSQFPEVVDGDGAAGAWGAMVGPSSGYLRSAPVNNYVGGSGAQLIKIATSADSTFSSAYGWIFDPATGNVWAAGFDADDIPIPKP